VLSLFVSVVSAELTKKMEGPGIPKVDVTNVLPPVWILIAYLFPVPGAFEQDPAVLPAAPGITVLNVPVRGLRSRIRLTDFSPVLGKSKYQPALEVVVVLESGRPQVNVDTVMVFVVVLTDPAASLPRPLMAASPAGDESAADDPLS
jgi:hypothetical protein